MCVCEVCVHVFEVCEVLLSPGTTECDMMVELYMRCVCVCEVCVHVYEVCEVLLSTECDMMAELYMRCVCVCVRGVCTCI